MRALPSIFFALAIVPVAGGHTASAKKAQPLAAKRADKLASIVLELVPADQTRRSRQLLLITTPDWASVRGTMVMLERSGAGWRHAGPAASVAIGRAGMGWGRGLTSRERAKATAEPRKREGDGRTPAGVYRLGTAFGYAARAPAGTRLSYRRTTARDYFVDDPLSADYNRWVSIPGDQVNAPAKRWRSFERMRRPDRIYELGVVVEHNTAPIVPGAGSAIFLHLWDRPGQPTAGCTAMARRDLLRVLRWLDPARHPLLVQLPRASSAWPEHG